MIFRIYEDGMGGYFGYWTTPGMDAVSGILAGPMLVLAILIGPLFCVMMFGAQLLLPTAIILLGLLMLYTPGSKNIRQNTLLVCTKMALSVPLFFLWRYLYCIHDRCGRKHHHRDFRAFDSTGDFGWLRSNTGNRGTYERACCTNASPVAG